jgi:hypothetical protein
VLDWLASVQIRKQSDTRVELDLTRATAWTGWAIVGVAARLLFVHAVWVKFIALAILGFGILLATLHRRLVFDREAGILHTEQRIFGIRRRAAIPLFHLRAVVVAARRGGIYVAYVERRIGGTIHLDEARRPAPLLELAEAVSEVAELRLVYDATTKMAAGD